MSFQADYFDGLSSRVQSVSVTVMAGAVPHIVFDAGGVITAIDLSAIEVQARLGSARRIVDLPGGGRLEAWDIGELETVMPSRASTFWAALHYLENHPGWVVISLMLTVFAGWIFLQFGVPRLAEYVADATPPSMESNLGEQVLKGLDHEFGYFSPSKIEKTHRDHIATALGDLCAHLKTCPGYRLEFRDGGVIGANAFALPGGIIVVTDQLVKLSQNDTEVIAVLAHELGHGQKRHAFRQSIQGVLSGLILAAATGDVSSMASGLPAVLMQMRYSREHEAEADSFALSALQESCLPAKAFADILQRLQAQTTAVDHAKPSNTNPSPPPQDAGPISEMLASHPDTQARIKPFLTAKENCS